MSRDTGYNEKIEKDIKTLENVLKFGNENAIVEHLNELISMIHLAEIDQINGRLKAKNKGETLLHIALKFKNTHEFIKEYLTIMDMLYRGTGVEEFNTFGNSFLTMFNLGLLDDLDDYRDDIEEKKSNYGVRYLTEYLRSRIRKKENTAGLKKYNKTNPEGDVTFIQLQSKSSQYPESH
uniref:Uncharacterized protein n=1 Tax=Magallana gigas TaxID=29159 RepID=A0A8W8JHQ6_MAGGI